MKIRNAIKFAVTGALAAAPIAAFAAAPAAFDNYTQDGAGNITSGTAGCSSLGVNEAGFAQEQCTIGGATYIHTILNDQAGFTDESWVEMGGTGGIADKQTVAETSGTEVFGSTAQLNTGSFEVVGVDTRIGLNQAISDSGAGFAAGFDFAEMNGTLALQGHDGTFVDLTLTSSASDSTYTGTFKFNNFNVEAATITAVDTNQFADANAAAAALSGQRIDQTAVLNDPGASIVQDFAIRERSGKFTAGPGLATGTVTWAAGDLIVDTQIGQAITGAGAFGLHDFANETQGTGTGVDSQTSSNPASFYTPAYTNTSLPDPFAAF